MRLVNVLRLLLILVGLRVVPTHAQLIERCDPKHIREERFHFPRLSDEDHAATSELVAQVRVKTGWSDAMLDSGVVLKGTLSYPDGTKRPVTIYYEGKRRLRIEEKAPSGKRVLVVDRYQASTVIQGSVQSLSIDTVLAEGTYLPFYSDITGPAADVRFTGKASATIGNVSASSFRSFHSSPLPIQAANQQSGSTQTFPYRISGRAVESEIFVDPTSFLPLEVKSCSPLPHNPNASRMVDRTFSQYTTQGGVAYPAHIEERIGGSRLYALDIASLEINQTLPASLWTLTGN